MHNFYNKTPIKIQKMSSRLFSIIRLSRMIVPVLFAGGMVACVDDNYDLNKDISMEVGYRW